MSNITNNSKPKINDAIAPDDDAFVRKFRITNQSENERDIRLFINSRFRIEDNADSVAVYDDPELKAIFHYKADHCFCERGTTVGTNKIGVGQFTTGEACPFRFRDEKRVRRKPRRR